MTVDSCATENPVGEILVAVPTTAEDSAGTSNCDIASPSDNAISGVKKRPSPVPVSNSKYESPMKKVFVELVAEEPVEAVGGGDCEGTGSPVAGNVEKQPTDKVAADEEAANEMTEKDDPEKDVAESSPVGEVELEVQTSQPIEAAESD